MWAADVPAAIHIYIYMYICMLLCSKMVFVSPTRSRMLSVMRSKMGCAASEGGKPLFLQCFVGFRSAAVIARGARNMRRRLGATCWKWGIFHHQFRCFTGGPAPWLQVSLRFAVVSRVHTCPELRGKWGFQVSGLEMAMRSPKTRVFEKSQNLFLVALPSSFLCWWCAWIWPKSCLGKWTNFGRNHCKRCARRSRLQKPFLHCRVRNRPC